MKLHVLPMAGAKVKVGGVVVAFVVVEVMNLLTHPQSSPNQRFNYKDMLKCVTLFVCARVVGLQNLLVAALEDIRGLVCQPRTYRGAVFGVAPVAPKVAAALVALVLGSGGNPGDPLFFLWPRIKGAMRNNRSACVGAIVSPRKPAKPFAADFALPVRLGRDDASVLECVFLLPCSIALHVAKRALGVFANRPFDGRVAMSTGFHGNKYSNLRDAYGDGNHYELLSEPRK